MLVLRKKIIPKEEIEAYIDLDHRLKTLEKRRDDMRSAICDKFRAGWVCTTKAEYVLVFEQFIRTSVDWKAWTRRLLKQVYGTSWKRYLARAIKDHQKPVERLVIVRK